MVKVLVSAGADVHAQEDYALRWSAENGHSEVVSYLMYDVHYAMVNEFAFKCNLIANTPCAGVVLKELARRTTIQQELSSSLPHQSHEHHRFPMSMRIQAMNDIIQQDSQRYLTEREYWDL